jgi:O-methyltransferase
MTTDARNMYLDLLKKTLSFLLWAEPPRPVDTFNFQNRPFKRFILGVASKVLKPTRFFLVERKDFSREQRESGEIWPIYAETMIGLKRLDNLQMCIETVLSEHIKGDFIETGVWRGGACIFMRAVLAANYIEDRKVYVADSFEGLPKPDPDKYPVDFGDEHHKNSYLAVSLEEVQGNFRKYGLLDDKVVFLKGWFKDTLPTAPITQLAVLRLDGDMYESTIDGLVNMYPRLSTGGFCIVDDYALETCHRAIDDFRASNGIKAEIKWIDSASVYWRKE